MRFGWMHVIVYTKKLFEFHASLAKFGKYFHNFFVIDDDLCSNLTLCCEINAYMNDIIVQQSIFWYAKPCHISTIPTKELRSITFNNIFPWNFAHT
jgi:hypothetical protein